MNPDKLAEDVGGGVDCSACVALSERVMAEASRGELAAVSFLLRHVSAEVARLTAVVSVIESAKVVERVDDLQARVMDMQGDGPRVPLVAVQEAVAALAARLCALERWRDEMDVAATAAVGRGVLERRGSLEARVSFLEGVVGAVTTPKQAVALRASSTGPAPLPVPGVDRPVLVGDRLWVLEVLARGGREVISREWFATRKLASDALELDPALASSRDCDGPSAWIYEARVTSFDLLGDPVFVPAASSDRRVVSGV